MYAGRAFHILLPAKTEMKHIFIILLGLFLASPLNAAETEFFTALSDVPVAPKTQEMVEHTVSFDKPDGRYVEIHALSDQAPETLEMYYRETLPQLGWYHVKNLQFRKYNEELILTIQSDKEITRLQLRLSPESG